MSDKHYTQSHDRTHLEEWLRRTQPWFETNATFLIYGLAAVLAVAAVVVWFQRQPPENAGVSAEWMTARQPEDFQAIADEDESTMLGQWARLRQATELLNSGIRNQFINREECRDELYQAEAAFNRLIGISSLDSAVHERVLIGLARLTETRCDGSEASVQNAIDAWKHLLDEYADSVAKEHAEQRIRQLSKDATAEFYAWFHGLDPKPADDLTPPGLPGRDVPSVPDIPDLSLIPELSGDDPFEFGDSENDSSGGGENLSKTPGEVPEKPAGEDSSHVSDELTPDSDNGQQPSDARGKDTDQEPAADSGNGVHGVPTDPQPVKPESLDEPVSDQVE